MSRRRHRLTLAVVVLGIGAVALGVGADGAPAGDDGAASGIADCTPTKDRQERLECYSRQVLHIRGDETLSSTIRTIDDAAKEDEQFARDCHQAMHPLGAADGEQLVEDDRPFPLLTTHSFCHEGYVHGLTIAFFEEGSRDELVGEAARACANGDVEATWSCAHSFGHLFASRERGHIERSAGLCAASLDGARDVPLVMDTPAWMASCVKGAIMEEMVWDGAHDVSVTPTDYCSRVEERARIYCDAFVMLRATLESEAIPARGAMCLTHVPAGSGREQCVRVYGRTAETDDQCDVLTQPRLVRVCLSERDSPDSLIN
jgi:hypothetical protein